MLWQSNVSPQPPATSALKVTGAEAVRQAALQASWRRDKRVAQRRLFWRWTLWYIQRFYVHALVALALVLGAVHFSDRWFAWPLPVGNQVAAPANTAVLEPSALPTSTASPPEEQPTSTMAMDWVGAPMTLHAAQQLGTQTPGKTTTTPAPSGPPDTLPLKPETWLHSKEP